MSKSLPWFKCFPDAWLDDTRDLTETQRSHYFDCLCLMYKYDKPVRDDDTWIAHQLHADLKKWKASRKALVACGKLIDTEAGLINDKAQRELCARAAQRSKKAEVATNRERKKRDEPEFSFENNKGKAQLCLVSATDRPQEGLHARAQSDHQIIEEEKKESLSSDAPLIDDDPYRRRRELSPAVVFSLRKKHGNEKIDRALVVYFRSEFAKNARHIDSAFPAWVESTNSDQQSPKDIASAILEQCRGADGKLSTALAGSAEALARRRARA